MKILINKANVENYCKMLEKGLDRFISFSKDHPSTQHNLYLSMAEWLKDNYKDKVALHILSFASASSYLFLDVKDVYPEKMLHYLYDIRYFVFANWLDLSKLLTLAEQNELSKNYVHFNFGVRKVQTLRSLL